MISPDDSQCPICFEPEASNFSLGCGCFCHLTCFASYLRSKDVKAWKKIGGVACPNAGLVGVCRDLKSDPKVVIDSPYAEQSQYVAPNSVLRPSNYLITPQELDYLLQKHTGSISYKENPSFRSLIEILRIDDSPKFHSWTNQDLNATLSDLPPELSRGTSDKSFSLIHATTKPCPKCGFSATHFHGHQCHHISAGCNECGEQFCYSCLQTASDNLRLRGAEGKCLCGYWSSFCDSSHSNIIRFLLYEPYPHDKRCGCPICPDCRIGKPCNFCYGNCVVCLGIVPPGPADLDHVEGWKTSLTEFRKTAENQMTLIRLVELGDEEAVSNLLIHSEILDVNMHDNTNRSALMVAASSCNLRILRLLLQHPGIDVNSCNRDGYTSLILASWYGNEEVVRLLLDARGIDVNYALPTNGNTALIWACITGHVNIVRMLLAMPGISVNHANFDGFTALMRACGNGHLKTVRLLLEMPGIDVNRAGNNRNTALILACLHGHEAVAGLLLVQPGIKINHLGRLDGTALTWAIFTKRKNIINLLIEQPNILIDRPWTIFATTNPRTLSAVYQNIYLYLSLISAYIYAIVKRVCFVQKLDVTLATLIVVRSAIVAALLSVVCCACYMRSGSASGLTKFDGIV